MMLGRRIGGWSAAVLVALILTPPIGLAAEHVMRMAIETEAGRFRFEPALLFIQPGDDIRFVPDSRLHGPKSIPGMLPGKEKGWRGRMGTELVVRFDRPGVYGFKCMAHYEVGMVALVVVGKDPGNWQAARDVRHPPMAAEAFDALFAAAACELPEPIHRECRPPASQ